MSLLITHHAACISNAAYAHNYRCVFPFAAYCISRQTNEASTASLHLASLFFSWSLWYQCQFCSSSCSCPVVIPEDYLGQIEWAQASQHWGTCSCLVSGVQVSSLNKSIISEEWIILLIQCLCCVQKSFYLVSVNTRSYWQTGCKIKKILEFFKSIIRMRSSINNYLKLIPAVHWLSNFITNHSIWLCSRVILADCGKQHCYCNRKQCNISISLYSNI